MAYIQKIPVNGTGQKLYPDAAMDAGTRGLVDMIDPWSWGGVIPADGALPIGDGPKNYPLSEDGWVEDQALAVTSTMLTVDGAVRFVDTDDILRMPVGFRHKVTDRHAGLVFWLKNLPDSGGAGSSNTIFASSTDDASYNISVGHAYSSPGVVSLARFRTAWSGAITLAETIRAAMFDGALHQFGFEWDLADDDATIDYHSYLDGALVATTTANVNGTMFAPASGDYAAFGQHPVGGSTINGTLWRAMMQELDVSGARAFSETVALDYSLNKSRIAAVSG